MKQIHIHAIEAVTRHACFEHTFNAIGTFARYFGQHRLRPVRSLRDAHKLREKSGPHILRHVTRVFCSMSSFGGKEWTTEEELGAKFFAGVEFLAQLDHLLK